MQIYRGVLQKMQNRVDNKYNVSIIIAKNALKALLNADFSFYSFTCCRNFTPSNLKNHDNMKNQTLIQSIILVLILIWNSELKCQNMKKAAVLNIYTNLPGFTSETMGNLFRIQLGKTEKLNVIDRWDLNTLINEKKINPNCNNTQCLCEIGNAIGVQKMFTGSVETYSKKTILVTVRMINVSDERAEKTKMLEFIYNPVEVGSMIDIVMRELLDLPVDINLKKKLSNPDDFASSRNTRSGRLNASGPRIGVSLLTGDQAKHFAESKQKGGFDGYPAMFQFGYQMEAQYLNEGAFQALFEFIPMVSGLDQGLFIPSFTLMNGLRNNRNGWEFAFGPTIVLNRMSDGYYENGVWHLESEWNDSIKNPNFMTTRIDSRGDYKVTSGFVFAFGKTFKSGNLNIPVNIYVIPSKEGVKFGASFGYNSKSRD